MFVLAQNIHHITPHNHAAITTYYTYVRVYDRAFLLTYNTRFYAFICRDRDRSSTLHQNLTGLFTLKLLNTTMIRFFFKKNNILCHPKLNTLKMRFKRRCVGGCYYAIHFGYIKSLNVVRRLQLTSHYFDRLHQITIITDKTSFVLSASKLVLKPLCNYYLIVN